MKDCLPVYKGVRYNSLAEISAKIREERNNLGETPQDAAMGGEDMGQPSKIPAPQIDKPTEDLSQFDIGSDSYKEADVYNKFIGQSPDKAEDIVMKQLDGKPGEDPKAVMERAVGIKAKGFENAGDGEYAIFTDPEGNMVSYGMISVDEATNKKYYVSYNPETKKQSVVSLEKAEEVFGQGYTAVRKDQPDSPMLSKYVTPEQWQKAINPETEENFNNWIYGSMSYEEQAAKKQADDKLKQEGIAFDPENPTTYTPSNKHWWFKSGVNNSVIGKAYQTLGWRNLKMHLFSGLEEGVKDPKKSTSGAPQIQYAQGKAVRAPIFDLDEYDPSFGEEVLSGFFSILMDAPLFAIYGGFGSRAGGKIGGKVVELMTRRNLIKYGSGTVDDLVAKGIARPLAERRVAIGLGKAIKKGQVIGSRFGSSAAALGIYDFQNDVLSQITESTGEWGDVDYAHALKEGAIGTTLGLGLGALGIGTSALTDLLARPGIGAVEKAAIKVGVGAVALPMEAGLFVYGKQGLQGKPLSEVTARDYGEMLGILMLLKGQHFIQGRGKKLFTKSKDHDPSKIMKGKFEVEFTPEEIEYINKNKEWGKTTPEIITNLVKTNGKFDPESKRISSIQINDIMADSNIPQQAKDKLIFTLGGWKRNFDTEVTGLNLRSEGDSHYLEARNKNGDLVDISKTNDINEANTRLQIASLGIIDRQKMNMFAEMPEMDKALVLGRIKGAGGDLDAVQAAWAEHHTTRTPDQQKIMEQLFSETEGLIADKQKAAEKAAKEAETAKPPKAEEPVKPKEEQEVKPEPEIKPEPKTPPETKEAIDTNPVTGAEPDHGAVPTGGTKPKVEEPVKPEVKPEVEKPKTEEPVKPVEKVPEPIKKESWQMTHKEYVETLPKRLTINVPMNTKGIKPPEGKEITFYGRSALGAKTSSYIIEDTPKNREWIKDNKYTIARNQASQNQGYEHENIVKDALEEGKSVPEEVLAEYPELKPKGTIRFNPDDRVIFTSRNGEKFDVNFRGYSNAGETKAVIADGKLGGQMEVDVDQLQAKEKEPDPKPEVEKVMLDTDPQVIIGEVLAQGRWAEPNNKISIESAQKLIKNKDAVLDETLATDLEDGEYVREVDEKGYPDKDEFIGGTYEITEKGRELIRAIEAREETIRGLNEGWDLFPSDADVEMIKANQKAAVPTKIKRTQLKSTEHAEATGKDVGVKIVTNDYRVGKRLAGTVHEFAFDETYEPLTTNRPERFVSELIVKDGDVVDQTKPIYTAFFGDFESALGYEFGTISNDLKTVMDILQRFDAQDAVMEVYDPVSKLMDSENIYPFQKTYTEKSLLETIKGEHADRLQAKVNEEVERKEDAWAEEEKKSKERKEFEEQSVPKEERPDPVEVAKEDVKAEDIPDKVYKERTKQYDEWVESNGLAIRTGERGKPAYFATPGMSTYYDPYSTNEKAKFYDISLSEFIVSESAEAKKLLHNALKTPDLKEEDRKRIQDALDNNGHLDYKLVDEVFAVQREAQRLGFDGLKVWENDDVGNPSSLFIWNNNTVLEVGSVKSIREAMLKGESWDDPRQLDIPLGETMEPVPPKKAGKKKPFTPMNDKDQKAVMKKLATGKNTMPILDEVMVKNGVATVSNLENTIEFKTPLPDGMYKMVGTDLVPSKTPVDEFPLKADPSKQYNQDKEKTFPVVKVEMKGIADALRSANMMVGKDELRPVMNAVNIKSDGKKVMIASTDGHRMFVKELDIKLPEFEILLPESAVKLLLSNPTADNFKFEIGKYNAKISTGDFDLTTRLVDGEYPNYPAVIPEQTYEHYTVGKSDLIAAIKAIIPYANAAKNFEFHVDAEKNEVTLRAENIDEGIEKSIKIKANIEKGKLQSSEMKDLRLLMPVMGEKTDPSINLNAKFLLSIAESIDSDNITIRNSKRLTKNEVQNRAFLIDGEKRVVKAEKEPVIKKEPVVPKENVDNLIKDFSRNFSTSTGMSDVVGGKDAIKLSKVDGFYMILDPSSTGINIESIWQPTNLREQGKARIYMKELTVLADKNNIPLTLRAVPEQVEGKDVIPKEKLKQSYEKLGFVFTGDQGVRLPETQNKPRRATKPSRGGEAYYPAEGDLSGLPKGNKGKKQAGEQPKGTEDSDIIIPEHWSKDVKPDEVFKSIDFPEMVEIVHKMINRYPDVKNMNNTRALGYFRHPSDGNASIALKRALFIEANYPMLKHVLAHEIGHLNDWFPDEDMRRGNILGRISSGKDYLSHTLGEKKGKTNILTSKDRERIRNEARKVVKEESKKSEKEIIEEIVREVPVFDEAGMNAEDVAAIWRDVNARENYPELYDYVARLNTAQKKQIMIEALKGIVNSDIAKKFKKQIGTTTVTEQIIKRYRPIANTVENVKKMYKKLLMEEINKRRLFDKETITKELLDVTKVWRAYNPAISSAKEKAYRESPEELYADAFSMLMNDPARLQKMAPVFYNAHFSWWDAKSGSKQYFDEIQQLLGSDKPPTFGEGGEDPLNERRLDNLMDGYKEGGQIRNDIADREQKSSLSTWGHIKREVLKTSVPMFSLIKRETGEKLSVDLNSEQAIDNAIQMLHFRRDKVGELLTDFNVMIEKPLADAGLHPLEFSALLEVERNLTQYKDKARPGGMQTEPSQQLKDYIYRRYTPEQRQVMESIIQDFHDKVFEVMDFGNQASLFTPEQWQIINEGKDVYATFSKVKYIHENFISSKIMEAEGSLEKNEDPFVATVIKMSATQKAADRNIAATAVVNDILKWAPKEIKVSSPIYIKDKKGVVKEVIEKPKEGYDHIVFFEDGKKKVAEVDKYIADIFNNPDGRQMLVGLTHFFKKYNSVFKPLVTSLNVGWAFYNNPSRDARRSMRNLFTILYSTEGISKKHAFTVVPKFIAGYSKQILYKDSEAKNYVKNNLDPAIREMISNGAITRGFFGSYDPYVSQHLEPVFKEMGFVGGKKKSFKDRMLERSLGPRQAAQLVDKMLYASSVIEATPKIVGYNILKDALKNETSAAYYTRNFVGTPFYYQKGKFTYATNEFAPFSNVILQGIATDFKLATDPKTRVAYGMYQSVMTGTNAVVSAAAAYGLFGEKIKQFYNMIDDYILSNYYVVPLGYSKDGKPVYLTLPMDEFGRLNYSITRALTSTVLKVFNSDLKNFDAYVNQFRQVISVGAGMVPSWSPLTTIVYGISDFLGGRNPNDPFTGRDVIPKNQFEAGRLESAPYVAKWAAEKSGGRWVMKLATHEKGKEPVWEYVFKNFPVLNRALRIGGTGIYQILSDEVIPVSQDRAKKRIKMDRVVNEAVIDANINQKTRDDYFDYHDQIIEEYFGGKDNYSAENEDQLRDLRSMQGKFKTRMSRGFDTPADQLISAVIDRGTTNDETVAILLKGSEWFTPEEYDDMLFEMTIDKIISKKVHEEVLKVINPEKAKVYEFLNDWND